MSCLVLWLSGEARITLPGPELSAVVRMNCCLGALEGFIAVTIWIFWPVCWSVTIWGCWRWKSETEREGEESLSEGVRAQSHVVTSTCLSLLKMKKTTGSSGVTFSGANSRGEYSSYLYSLWCCGGLSGDDLKALWRLTHHWVWRRGRHLQTHFNKLKHM